MKNVLAPSTFKEKIVMTVLKKYVALFVLFALTLCSVVGLAACDNTTDPEYFNVTYVYGNGQDNVTLSVKSGECATEPREPSRNGYTFDGWFVDGASTPYDFSTPVTADVTLSARWTEEEIPVTPTDVRLNWQNSDAASFLFDSGTPRTAHAGDRITFRIYTSPYYSLASGSAFVVTAGGAEIVRESQLPDESKEFSFTVPSDISTILIEIKGLQRDSSAINGSGTSSDPYVIVTAAQFVAMSDAINKANDDKYNSAYISLEADINFKGEELDPIGIDLSYTYFSGTFYGNGHTISNFSIISQNSVVGLFGYVAQAYIADLNIEGAEYFVGASAKKNYIVGGIAAYNIGSDIVGCSVNAEFNVNLTVAPDATTLEPVVYLGGIVGFAQGYGTTYSATISYCSVEGNLNSSGRYPLAAVGGIAGALYGAAESAPAMITNCAYVGNIGGAGSARMAGGIAGYLRTYTAIANCYAEGEFTAQNASGALVGLAENETAVTYSYAVATLHTTEQASNTNTLSSDVVGSYYKAGAQLEDIPLLSIDGREVFVYNSYVAENGSIGNVNVSDFAKIKALLGWTDADWDFQNGRPVVVPEGEQEIDIAVTFQLERAVTFNGTSSTTDVITVSGGYIPLYWAQDGSGKNTFLADDGSVSYGFFLDEAHTMRLPAAMPITQSMTVYVGFADYSEVAGTYYAVIMVGAYRANITLEFNELGRMTMAYEGKISYDMYTYDGEKIYIRNAYFATVAYTSTSSLATDYYAEILADGSLKIYDNYFYTTSQKASVGAFYAYKQNAAMGDWYAQDGSIYTFMADGTGTSTTLGQFSYTCVNNVVTILFGGSAPIVAIISDDGEIMTSDGEIILSITRFDDFVGTWEGEYGRNFSVTFDGKGKATLNGQNYNYTVNKGVLSFGDYTAKFNDDKLLELFNGTETLVLGREGSYIGFWVETWLDYSLQLYGIGRDGYGFAQDSRGYQLTYTAEWSDDGGYYNLTFYYRMGMYGFGYEHPADVSLGLGSGSQLWLSMYTPDSGYMVDDYNMVYVDIFQGVWNAADGTTLEFNGYGGYNVSFQMSDGTMWIAQGEVVVTTANGSKQTVRYTFDRNDCTATFNVGNTTYVAKYGYNGLSVTANGGAATTYLAPDVFANVSFQSVNGDLLTFNGKSNVNLGVATLTLNGVEAKYGYTLDGDVATLTQNGVAVYTATINRETRMLDVVATSGAKTEFGLYSPMFGKTYIFSDDITFTLHGVFDLGGYATATFIGQEVTLLLYSDNAVAVYFGSANPEFYLVWYDENNVALFDEYQDFVGMLCVPDGWGGTYVAENGDMLYIDGRGLIVGYYAIAQLTTAEEKVSYVYELEDDGTITLYERNNGTSAMTARYYVSRSYVNGATAFVSESGDTVYLVVID